MLPTNEDLEKIKFNCMQAQQTITYNKESIISEIWLDSIIEMYKRNEHLSQQEKNIAIRAINEIRKYRKEVWVVHHISTKEKEKTQ